MNTKIKRVPHNKTHGHSAGNETPEYKSWGAMKTRCYNVNNINYPEWGGRGITVCDRWLHSFENFLEDMGARPSLEYTLERRDNDKGYYKGNCYWATRKEQNNNKRNNVLITYNNKTQTLKQWSEELGVPYKNLHARINYYKWPIETAFALGKQHGGQYYSRPKVA